MRQPVTWHGSDGVPCELLFRLQKLGSKLEPITNVGCDNRVDMHARAPVINYRVDFNMINERAMKNPREKYTYFSSEITLGER